LDAKSAGCLVLDRGGPICFYHHQTGISVEFACGSAVSKRAIEAVFEGEVSEERGAIHRNGQW